MARLGDTLRNLAATRRLRGGALGNVAEPGRLTQVSPRGSNPGALRMLTYVPPGLSAGAPLVVVLHGCTQNAAGYDHGAGWSMLAQRHGFALLFPEQERGNNPNLCFNWFQPADVTRGQGEVFSIKQMIDQMLADHALSSHRVYITGLSAGGAMAAAMLATYPETFAGGAIIAGLPYGAAAGMQQAFEAMHSVRRREPREWGDVVRSASPHSGPWPQVQIWQGDADATVHQGNAGELVKQWADVHAVRGTPFEDRVQGALHRAWRDAADRVLVESYLIPGMAHGTPLDTRADDVDQSMGSAAPFMLEAGISSTWFVARSWGLLTQAARSRPAGATTRRAPGPGPGPGVVIENALRSVGLRPR